MSYQDWLPAAWKPSANEDTPFRALRKRIDNMFDDFDNGFFDRDPAFALRSNVSETEDEICVTAELPGLTDKDVEVSIAGDHITIKGEKKSEKEEKKEEKGREFHRVERMSGSFHRSMRLPFEIDPDKVDATVKDGVLTVTVAKPAEVAAKTRKIDVKHAT